MFKKLKQKITEEQQSPQKTLPSPSRQSPDHLPSGHRSRTSSLTEQQDEGSSTPDKESASRSPFSLSPDAVNGNEVSATQRNEQSFTQKLQLRVPSMESLFRSPVKESLFRSPSKESLVRSSSRDSLNRLDTDGTITTFDPPSDIESEAEESLANLEGLSKEQLFHRLRRMERSLGNYRGKYSELVTTYRIVQREKEKLQSILSQSQDKALRRISELREELQMDQQAKKHLQEEFDASLEEKDQLITVLQTQVSLLKQRLGTGQANTDIPEQTVESESTSPNLTQEINVENTSTSADGSGDAVKTLEGLQVRVRRQENILQRCKEMIRSHKERATQLSSENEALQEQLQERLQELEKIKELRTGEKSKLINQLRDAKNKIEELEQDKGMVIAETKRQMHETLEIKEDEISQLRVRLKQITAQCDELHEQKEKLEKAAFEELEKALRTSQKTEEAQKQGNAQMVEQIIAIEKASEDERRNLQQELTRVKQEVVDIMKKSSEERIAKLEQLHAEQLASKDQELKERLQTQELAFAEQMKAALVNSRVEYLNTIQTKEQDCLALEELELQKKAIQSQSENRLQELQQETETLRTRILELESSLVKCSEDCKHQIEEQGAHVESERNMHHTEITNMVEKHKEELGRLHQELENVWIEKLHCLQKEHNSKMEEHIEKNLNDHDALLKEKETLFHAHIKEMNERTLEKLDVKQTELEALSSELVEALKARQELEQKLSVVHNERESLILELDTKLEQERSLNNEKIYAIEKDKISAQELLRSFKDEVVTLETKLREKQKELEEIQAREDALTKAANKSEVQLVEMTAKLEDLSQSHKNNFTVQVQLHEAQLEELRKKLEDLEVEKSQLKDKEEATESQLMNISTELSSFKNQVNELQKQLEEQNDEVVQKLHILTQEHESEKKCFFEERERIIKDADDREKEIAQMRVLQSEQMEDFKQKLNAEKERVSTLQEDYEKKLKNQEAKMEKLKQKAKEMHETFKHKLSEQESKFIKEVENKQEELIEKEKQFNEKMLEMAQAGSIGIDDAVSQLDRNHKEQLERLSEGHRRQLEETTQTWVKKLDQHIDEMQEKHELELQEKDLTLTELKQKLDIINSEKDEASMVIEQMKVEQVNKEVAFKELQEGLTQASTQVTALLREETTLKSKLESLEVDLSRTLIEKTTFQEQIDELVAAGEKDKNRVTELVDMLKEANEKLEVLESSHSRKQEEFEKQLEDKLAAAQQKENEFYKLLRELTTQLQTCCTDTEASLQASAIDFNAKCNDKINVVIARMRHCQNQVAKIKEAIVLQARKIVDLEAQLEEVNTQHTLLDSSLQNAIQNLQDKESEILTMREEIQCLNTHKEALQNEGGHHQKVATEKDACITKLKKELSENSNALTVMQEELKGKESQINSLNMQINDLRSNLENSIGIAEKEASRYSLSKQHENDLSSKLETLSQERAIALEQLDCSKNKLSEWKKKAETRFTHNHNTIKELQAKLDMTNREINEKGEQVCRLKEELDQKSKSLDSLKAEVQGMQTFGDQKHNDFTAELEAKKVRIEELENHISKITKENQCIVEEMKRQSHQRDIEQKELVQQLQNAQVTVFDKDNRHMEAEQKVLDLEKEMAALKTELETRQRDFELLRVDLVASRADEVKALEIRLTESAAKHAELKKKAEQKIAAVKKQLISQVEEKDRYKMDLENQLQDLKQKMQERENRIRTLEVKIKSIEDSSGLEKEEMQREVQNVKAAIEQERASTLENMQQMYEGKIKILQKDTAENERHLQRQCDEIEEKNVLESRMQSTYEELQKKLESAEKDRQQQQTVVIELQHQLESQKQKYSLLSDQHKQKEGELKNLKKELQLKKTELKGFGKVVEELHEKLREIESSMKEKDETMLKENEVHKLQTEHSSLEHESTLKDLQEQMDKKDVLIRTLEENAADKAKSDGELQKLLVEMQSQLKELKVKLNEAEKEKQKLCKDIAKAQKDLRVLRKEQQQELEIMKKELADETEQKIKHEQEDLELKHNSALKQLMREVNTQMAKKERELETAVQETISKAQEVEAELMQSHQIEATQLHKRIAEKDDDLKRTVKKYEEILEAREEEMTAKVSELQAKLEELQSEHAQVLAEQNRSSEEVIVEDLQSQVSQKISLLNEAKLKEQEYKEQVHTLADQLKKYERNVFVTPLGLPYKDGHRHTDVSAFGEPTEFEYLRKVMYEYMMGRETKTMAKVITTVLRFPADQTQMILEREESKPLSWLRPLT